MRKKDKDYAKVVTIQGKGIFCGLRYLNGHGVASMVLQKGIRIDRFIQLFKTFPSKILLCRPQKEIKHHKPSQFLFLDSIFDEMDSLNEGELLRRSHSNRARAPLAIDGAADC